MFDIKSYIIHVIGAAIICSIAVSLAKTGNSVATICKFICALFLVFNIIGPLLNIRVSEFMFYQEHIFLEAEKYVSDGEKYAADIKSRIIKERCEEYILDKAASLHTGVDVQVQLDHNGLSPCMVIISGAVSPYAKIQLQEYIEQTLGVPEEAQTWILH